MKRKMKAEQVRWWQEVRRSSAASPHRNKARYTRKVKHKDKVDQ